MPESLLEEEPDEEPGESGEEFSEDETLDVDPPDWEPPGESSEEPPAEDEPPGAGLLDEELSDEPSEEPLVEESPDEEPAVEEPAEETSPDEDPVFARAVATGSAADWWATDSIAEMRLPIPGLGCAGAGLSVVPEPVESPLEPGLLLERELPEPGPEFELLLPDFDPLLPDEESLTPEPACMADTIAPIPGLSVEVGCCSATAAGGVVVNEIAILFVSGVATTTLPSTVVVTVSPPVGSGARKVNFEVPRWPTKGTTVGLASVPTFTVRSVVLAVSSAVSDTSMCAIQATPAGTIKCPGVWREVCVTATAAEAAEAGAGVSSVADGTTIDNTAGDPAVDEASAVTEAARTPWAA